MVMSPSKKCKRGLSQQRRDALAVHVHAEHVPVGVLEDARRQVMADEAIDAEDQDILHPTHSMTGRSGSARSPKRR